MEEEREEFKEHSEEEQGRAMSMALQWLCSPRGGNNFYGRILNGCGRSPQKNMWPPTAAVTLDTKGRYMLVWHPEWFVRQDGPFQLLVVVHEAAHLSLQHLEKMLRWRLRIQDVIKYKRLEPVMNVAADMAVNDIALRPMMDIAGTTFPQYKERFIWPEAMEYPEGETFEYYFNRLMDDLKKEGFDPDCPKAPSMGGTGGSCDGKSDKQDKQDSQQQGGSDDEERKLVSTGPRSDQEGDGRGGDEQHDDEQTGDSSFPGGQGEADAPPSDESGSADGEGSPGGDNGDVRPGDCLDDNYPNWFKDLLNNQFPRNVMFDLKFDDMSSAEIERAIDRAKREAKRITKHAVDQTKKSRGTIPGQFLEAIQELLEEPTIPWQIVFQNMMKSEVSSKLDESTAYPNPCFFHLEDEGMEPYPGFQKNFAFNIAVMVDTSGSVSRQEFLDFMAEIRGIMEQEDEVTVRLIMFDAAIQYEKLLNAEDTEEYTKDRYRRINRYGHGGTDFAPPLRYMCGEDTEKDWKTEEREDSPMKEPPDLAILLTDGGAPVGPPYGPIPKHLPPCPLIWVLTSNGREDDYMQPRVLRIKD